MPCSVLTFIPRPSTGRWCRPRPWRLPLRQTPMLLTRWVSSKPFCRFVGPRSCSAPAASSCGRRASNCASPTTPLLPPNSPRADRCRSTACKAMRSKRCGPTTFRRCKAISPIISTISGNPAFHGHLGDIAIPRSCAQSAFVLPTPVTAIAGWPAPSACPPDFTSFDGLCQAPRCPPGHGGGVQCCPQGTAPGANGECEPLRGGNLGCPIGAAALRGSDGSIRCAWLARCPEGAQADLRGGCERVCPPGETAWRSRKCCGYGEVGLPDGQCCPERDVRDGKCVQACPEGAVRMPDGQCCPRQDVHDGKCTQACPEGAVRMPDGQCCPRQDVHDGKCVQACPEGAIRLPNGECCTRQDVRDGKCVQACPEGAVRMPGGECCPRQDVRDGHCEHACNPGYHPADGRCVIDCPRGEAPGPDNLCHRTGGPILCTPGLTRVNGACVNLRTPRACQPGEIRRYDGLCVPRVPRRPEWRPRHPVGPYEGPYRRPPGYPPQRGANPWLAPGPGYREY